jgi:hypothetical protein
MYSNLQTKIVTPVGQPRAEKGDVSSPATTSNSDVPGHYCPELTLVNRSKSGQPLAVAKVFHLCPAMGSVFCPMEMIAEPGELL